jgi:HSP20 family molecular chaperone IbpA
MALLDVIIPQLLNCAQNCNLPESLFDQDWNHWKLQIQSLIEDAKQGSQTSGADFCRAGTSQSSDNQQNNGMNLDQLQQIVANFLGLAHKKQASDEDLVKNEGNKYKIKLNVSHFEPQEITVKTVGNDVVVIGKHDERKDRLGLVSRQFTRRYQLPDDVEPETVVSALTPKGILIIEGLKKATEPKPNGERVIPVIHKGNNPSKSGGNYENEQNLD